MACVGSAGWLDEAIQERFVKLFLISALGGWPMAVAHINLHIWDV